MLVDDFAPSDSESAVILDSFSFVDIGNSLSKIEVTTLSLVEILNSDKMLSFVLSSLSSSETNENSLGVEPNLVKFN